MDPTHAASQPSPVSGATLVTLLGLASGNAGFIAGLFGGIAGDQTLYAATATGFAAAAVFFTMSMSIAKFVRTNRT
ncbi:hypothetical protein ACN6LD_002438 [Streptomyces sp. SAS_272]